MSANGFLIFHLNLAFSSIAEELRVEVIKNSYHPLLRLARETDVPIGVELSAWTLGEIEKLDPEWLGLFRSLLNEKKCELIGSGYVQLIGPLVPYEVNYRNQQIGLEMYERILGLSPRIALVSEMAFSSGLVEIYSEAGYEGIIMDRDNVRLALNIHERSREIVPTHALGAEGIALPVLWADSILFQRMQHFVHGDISLGDYVSHLDSRIQSGESLLPIYCNDAEIFDYRPGRFTEEARIHHEGEWKRMNRLLLTLDQKLDLDWVLPSQALEIVQTSMPKRIGTLTSIMQPIPVKKQAKYNIARWAVTGRNDLWLNTMCHRLYRKFDADQSEGMEVPAENWRMLCEFWASDLRTHIEENRWNRTLSEIDRFLESQEVATVSEDESSNRGAVRPDFETHEDEEGIYLTVKSPNLEVVLNLRRGLALKTLAFRKHGFQALIGSLPHGHFNSIAFGADYYSGNLVADLPADRSRTTDLERVEPEFVWTDKGLLIRANINTKLGRLRKTITVNSDDECLSIGYSLEGQTKPLASIRAAAVTFLPGGLDDEVQLRVVNGGREQEVFPLDGNFDHTAPASTLVSSTSGLGATDGRISFWLGKRALRFSWDPASCAAMPMIQHRYNSKNNLLRLFFSLSEIDDTASAGKDILPFELTIAPEQVGR